MVREDGKRNFVLVENDGTESSVFSGSYPRQAALKAARRLHPAPSQDDIDGHAVLKLRERGTDKVHVYHGWAWMEAKDEDAPAWMDDFVTRSNVSKQGIEHRDE
ncbi:non-histone chromosomal MC1 family protein [Haloferax sp. DFSO60]|uniref:non-histone chromosomal MC1 family protein n=1 Tax=Haloferax sp. DFSO60 TaxID=3388652 RepID=UPI0039793B59